MTIETIDSVVMNSDFCETTLYILNENLNFDTSLMEVKSGII